MSDDTTDVVTPAWARRVRDELPSLLWQEYGLDAQRISSVSAELAAVFRVTTPSGDIAVKCLQHSDETAAAFRWQGEAMVTAAGASLPVPLVVRDVNGEATSDVICGGGRILVQVSEWLPGVPLADAAHAPALMFDVGRTAGRLSLALALTPLRPPDIDHPWDARCTATTLSRLLPRLAGHDLARLLEASLARFAGEVAPVVHALPRAAVHQDLHDSNLLVSPNSHERNRVAGILDFGDGGLGLRVSELSVAAAYAARGSDDPVGTFRTVVAGWISIAPLTDLEADCVYPLAIGRLAVNAGMWATRAGEREDTYALERSRGSAAALTSMLAVPSRLVAAYTAGSAQVNHHEDTTGRLVEGFHTDLAVLDRDPFTGPADSVIEATVRRTYVGGDCVFRRD